MISLSATAGCRDRAGAAGADPGQRDAADQHRARPGPLQHAGARRGEPRRGGGEDLQLRLRPRRDAGRHGEAVRGGRGRRRGDRPLRPRRRRRRRQEGLPLPQHGKAGSVQLLKRAVSFVHHVSAGGDGQC
jgi:hypothetical protein